MPRSKRLLSKRLWVPRTIFTRVLVCGFLGACFFSYLILAALGQYHHSLSSPLEERVADTHFVEEKALPYHDKAGKISDLKARATGDTTYQGRIDTGRMLFCLMKNPGAIQSDYTYDDLRRWGWSSAPLSATKIEEYQLDVLDAYSDYSIDESGDQGPGYAQLIPFPSSNGKEQAATLGTYQNLVNSVSGSIVAGENYSPSARLNDDVGVGKWTADMVPELGTWSDVVALQWEEYASNGAALQYIFRSNIQNENTKQIIMVALYAMGETQVPTYPGVTIEVDYTGEGDYANSFYAILGTYHGAGPAYMLAQHQSLFRSRLILKVQVWSKQYSWKIDGSSGDIKHFSPSAVFFVSAPPS